MIGSARGKRCALVAFASTLLIFSIAAGAAENLQASLQNKPGNPRCDVKGNTELTITCNYSPAPNAAGQSNAPRITLDHASFSFDTSDDSHMRIGLTFSNRGTAALSESRTVYIAVDGADSKNYLRRPLPHVELRKLAPHQTLAFTEILLSPAYPRGTYIIKLWIPSPDDSLKFDAAHNLLLDSAGVADSATGMNKLATFKVNTMSGHKKRQQ